MLELPEIEILRRETEREIGGRKLKSITVDPEHLAGGLDPLEFARLEGLKVSAVKRRGTHLVFNVENGERVLVKVADGVALRRAKTDDPLWAEFTFTQGASLRLLAGVGDPRVGLTTVAELDVVVPPTKAIDLAEQAVSWVVFARALVGHGGAVRALLIDPVVVEGIGTMYADEILWRAGLRPERRVEKLGSQELRRLYRAVAEVIHDALKAGGTTTAVNQFSDLAGGKGAFQEQLEVWGRDGQPCRRCRGTVVLDKIDGKPAYRCAECQV